MKDWILAICETAVKQTLVVLWAFTITIFVILSTPAFARIAAEGTQPDVVGSVAFGSPHSPDPSHVFISLLSINSREDPEVGPQRNLPLLL